VESANEKKNPAGSATDDLVDFGVVQEHPRRSASEWDAATCATPALGKPATHTRPAAARLQAIGSRTTKHFPKLIRRECEVGVPRGTNHPN